MPSTAIEPPRRSLRGRVLRSSVLSAAAGAALAAVTAGIATAGLVEEHEEEALAIATMRLAEEVEEEEREDAETAEEALADELGDVDHVDARGAIRQGGGLLAGDAAVPTLPPGTCAKLSIDGGPHRVCTTALRGREVSLAVSTAHTEALRPLYGAAALLGIGVGVLAAIALGHRTVRWGLGPLFALRDQVRLVRPESPSAEGLLPQAEYAEIEDLRRVVVELVERLGDALAQAQRFASQASHELRTPLTSIAGEIELLAEASSARDAEVLSAVRTRVHAMSKLVERLLVLAVPHAPTAGEAVDLADVVDAAAVALPVHQRARVRSTVPDDVLVRGDSTLLVAAVTNGLENALKFSAEEVELRVTASGEEVWIEVADRGPGVPRGERARVFEAFYRAPGARGSGVPGSGVGLALIAHVARVHGGRAELVEVRQGTCLRVILPRWGEEPGSRAARSASVEPGAPDLTSPRRAVEEEPS